MQRTLEKCHQIDFSWIFHTKNETYEKINSINKQTKQNKKKTQRLLRFFLPVAMRRCLCARTTGFFRVFVGCCLTIFENAVICC
jgi:predicted urease superfamily metal-dependent hydrolase